VSLQFATSFIGSASAVGYRDFNPKSCNGRPVPACGNVTGGLSSNFLLAHEVSPATDL
jgi:hypothetical protein